MNNKLMYNPIILNKNVNIGQNAQSKEILIILTYVE